MVSRTLRVRAGGLATVWVLLAAAVLVTGTAPAVASETGPPPPNPSSDLERRIAEEVFRRVRDERAARGLPPVLWDGDLAPIAAHWSIGMAVEGRLSHRHPSREPQAAPWGLVQYAWSGENAALSYVGTGASLHRAWMHSAPHRDWMLSPYIDTIAVGVHCAADGSIWGALQMGMHHDGRHQRASGHGTDRREVAANPPSPQRPIVHDTDAGGGCRPAVHGLPEATVFSHEQERRGTEWGWGSTLADVHRIAGDSRVTTAAAVSRSGWPRGAIAAVIADGAAYPDALAGSYLAGVLDAPVLLTTGRELHAATAAELRRLSPDRVYILGGPAAVPPLVARQVADIAPVERLAGPTRFATATAIAVAAADRARPDDGDDTEDGQGPDGGDDDAGDGGDGDAGEGGDDAGEGGDDDAGDGGDDAGDGGDDDVERMAFLAFGHNWPDALVAGAVAAGEQIPLLLTPTDTLHPDTAVALRQLEIDRVVVLGGTDAVSAQVVSELRRRGLQVTRIAGPTRFDTAVAVAQFALDEFAWTPAATTVVTGRNFPDGLSVAPLAGRDRTPVLLAAGPDRLGAASAVLTDLGCAHDHVRFIGGPAVLGGLAVLRARQAAACHDGVWSR